MINLTHLKKYAFEKGALFGKNVVFQNKMKSLREKVRNVERFHLCILPEF